MGNKASISSTNTESPSPTHHPRSLLSSRLARRRPRLVLHFAKKAPALNTNTADAEMRTAIVPGTNRLAHAVDFLLSLFFPPRKAVQNISYARGVIVSTSARRAVDLGLSLMTRGRVETCASFSVGVQYRNPLWTPIVPNMSA